ncbi:kinase-like domain-containing protein [Mycena epipterygia]|nr:kinase-like domain-containing protein [Mycena epipterygia]
MSSGDDGSQVPEEDSELSDVPPFGVVPEASTHPAKPISKYECSYCGKGFSRPSSLKIHLNSHTGEKPFICPFEGCGRGFTVLINMRRHSRVHATSQPYDSRPGHNGRRNLRRASSSNSSDGQSSAWMSGLSDAGSSESSIGSPFPSTSRNEWNIPSYDLPSHQLVLKDLDLTGKVTKLDQYPFESGGVADIYRGILNPSKSPIDRLSWSTYDGVRQVAVKIFRRMHSEQETLEKTSRFLYEEARRWKRLDHPNILPFLGISLDLGLSPALVSPFCLSGAIIKYLSHNSKNPKERLQMAIDVADGLAYLHSEGIVHGNFSTKKILVDNEGSPMICGYGMTASQPANTTSSLFSFPIRFTSPECFSINGETSPVRTASADVYAFSMVTLEILSGLEPYHHLPTEHAVFMHIIRGDRPIRTHLDHQAVTNRIWRLLTSLWKQEPYLRPDMTDVARSLIQIRDNEDAMDEDFEPSEPESNRPRDDNEERSSSGEETFFGDSYLPDSQGRDLKGRVTQDDQYPFAGGGNSNIYRGKLTRSDGRKIRVAIKMIRMSDDGSGQLEHILRHLKREVDVWSRIKHNNVLPFIGVCDDIAPSPVLISPFYKFGHVATYLRKHPEANREELVHGVASGLQFLHDNDIIHGDLKVQNVLVDKRGTPCICDFGLAKVINRRGFTTSSVGTAPYMAPELLFVIDGATDETASPSTTKSSDIYSFALLALEILTSESPKGRPSRPIVTVKVLADLRPKRADYSINEVTNEMWSVLDRCWNFEPLLRPTITEVQRSLPISVMSDIENPNEMGLPSELPLKKMRTDTLITPVQSAVLHALLAQSRFPTIAMREEVGRSIGMSARRVQIWFQKQRARRTEDQSHSLLSGLPPLPIVSMASYASTSKHTMENIS